MPCPIIDLSYRTGLYAESHGIVANVSHNGAVLNSRLTPRAELLGCRDRFRVSLQQHLVISTSLVAWRTGAGVAILCHFRTLLTSVADVGNGWESGSHFCQPYVVRFIALPFLCHPTSIVRPGPPQTLSEASPTYFVPWAVCAFIHGFHHVFSMILLG